MDEKKIELYFLNEDSAKELWKNCIFVFDTSSLLEFYFFSKKTQDDIFNKIFKTLKGRLWIPSHVEFEYLKNREKTLRKPISEKYQSLDSEIFNKIQENIAQLKKRADELKEKTKNSEAHPYISPQTTEALIIHFKEAEEAYLKIESEIKKEVKAREQEINANVENDNILSQFKQYLQVGKEYSFDQIIQIAQEGELRYRLEVSPGYKDAQGQTKKTGVNKFGDLIVWKQIIEYAKENGQAIVLITNDLKEDWCYAYKSGSTKRVERPKEDLIKEIYDIAHVRFWMYTIPQFLYEANKLLNLEVMEDAILEVQSKSSRIDAIIDQENVGQGNLGCALNEGFKFVAQTYKAGVSGLLKSISVSIQTHRNQSIAYRVYPFLFEIYEVDNLFPSNRLISFTLNSDAFNIDDVIALPVGIRQEKDAKYAIAVSFYDAPRHGPDKPNGSWSGSTANLYKDGELCFSEDGKTWQLSSPNDHDLHFRTYVTPE